MVAYEDMSTDAERRVWLRYAFGAVQEIAEVADGKMPSHDAFERIRCVDISRAGFSFYRPTRPKHESLVVSLGDTPDRTYLSVRVVQAMKQVRDGHELYRIGCEFTARLLRRGDDFVPAEQASETAFFLMASVPEKV